MRSYSFLKYIIADYHKSKKHISSLYKYIPISPQCLPLQRKITYHAY